MFKCLVIWFKRWMEKNVLIVKYILYASHKNINQLTETGSRENCMAQKLANGMWRPSSLRSWVESRTCWKQLETVSQYSEKFKAELLVPFIISSPFLFRNIHNSWCRSMENFQLFWLFLEVDCATGLLTSFLAMLLISHLSSVCSPSYGTRHPFIPGMSSQLTRVASVMVPSCPDTALVITNYSGRPTNCSWLLPYCPSTGLSHWQYELDQTHCFTDTSINQSQSLSPVRRAVFSSGASPPIPQQSHPLSHQLYPSGSSSPTQRQPHLPAAPAVDASLISLQVVTLRTNTPISVGFLHHCIWGDLKGLFLQHAQVSPQQHLPPTMLLQRPPQHVLPFLKGAALSPHAT